MKLMHVDNHITTTSPGGIAAPDSIVSCVEIYKK
jgi:hypothetical protein